MLFQGIIGRLSILLGADYPGIELRLCAAGELLDHQKRPAAAGHYRPAAFQNPEFHWELAEQFYPAILVLVAGEHWAREVGGAHDGLRTWMPTQARARTV